MPIAIALLKGVANTLIGATESSATRSALVSEETSPALDSTAAEPVPETDAPLINTEWRERFRKLFETYFATLVKHIAKDHGVSPSLPSSPVA